MGRRILLALATAVSFPASALAAAHYFPKPHQHCRAHYVRRTLNVREHKHGKTVIVKRAECVHVAPTTSTPTTPAPIPTSTFVNASFATSEYPTPFSYLLVTGSILSRNGTQLVGQPITYTITDATTGQPIGSFTGLSNAYASCSVVLTLNSTDTVQTFTGQAVAPYSACGLGSVSMPAADTAVFAGSFAGNSTYSPSASSQEAF